MRFFHVTLGSIMPKKTQKEIEEDKEIIEAVSKDPESYRSALRDYHKNNFCQVFWSEATATFGLVALFMEIDRAGHTAEERDQAFDRVVNFFVSQKQGKIAEYLGAAKDFKPDDEVSELLFYDVEDMQVDLNYALSFVKKTIKDMYGEWRKTGG